MEVAEVAKSVKARGKIWGDYLQLLHIWLPPVPPVSPAFTYPIRMD